MGARPAACHAGGVTGIAAVTAEATRDAAPFTSGTSALSFAYRHSHGDYPANQFAQWAKRAAGKAGTGPAAAHGLDAAMLAGWVRRTVEGGGGLRGLPEPQRSVLLAKFAVDSRLNLTAKLAVLDALIASGVGGGEGRRRLVDLCVQRYFGGTMLCADGERRPIRQRQVAECCDVTQQAVSLACVPITAWLRAMEREAMDQVVDNLVARQLIPGAIN